MSKDLTLRYQIILLAHAQKSNSRIAKELGITRLTVLKWRGRWHDCQLELSYYEKSITQKRDKKSLLLKKMEEIVSDAPRSGSPSVISIAAVQAIRAMACQQPSDYGLPHDKWSGELLAQTAIREGLVEKISGRYVQKLLKKNLIRPHKVEYWLHPKIEDRPSFLVRVSMICWLYINALWLKEEANTVVVCIDEKTGIQAINRLKEDLPVAENKTRKQEFGYKRNGTVDLFAARLVHNGQLIHHKCSETHNAKDMFEFTTQTVEKLRAEQPNVNIVFVLDQYSTHKSEELVRWIAQMEYPNLTEQQLEIELGLGKKGKSGILKSKKTRMAFLEKSEHQIQFFFTPVHSSWLNQIENWFGSLTRHALKNASFPNKEELIKKIEHYVEYYNILLAKPFNWRFGKKSIVNVFNS